MSESNRIKWITEHRGTALADLCFSRENRILKPAEIINLFRAADPSRNASMTEWLIHSYARNGFSLNDIEGGEQSSVAGILSSFLMCRKQLPSGERDINRYLTPEEVLSAVEPYIQAEKERHYMKLLHHSRNPDEQVFLKNKARFESTVLLERDGFTVVIPLTEFASCWWGLGTSWCTAAENKNSFVHYDRRAPLIIIILPDGGKLQMYGTWNEFQFMDETDNSVSFKITERYGNIIFPLLFYLLTESEYPGLVRHIPARMLTYEMCLNAVSFRASYIRYVPRRLLTDKLCRLAVSQNSDAIRHIPKRMLSSEFCRFAAVECFYSTLNCLPENRVTGELCMLAVRKNGRALFSVPKHLITAEMCRIAVDMDSYAIIAVPEQFRTRELCRIALHNNPLLINILPGKEKTNEMFRFVMERLADISSEEAASVSDEELYAIAVIKNPMALNVIPDDMKTVRMCKDAVMMHGLTLAYVPVSLRSPALCRMAVERRGTSLCHVPDELRTAELCEIAVRTDGEALQSVPPELHTAAMYADALSGNPERPGHIRLFMVRDDLRFEPVGLPYAPRTPESLAGLLNVMKDVRPRKRDRIIHTVHVGLFRFRKLFGTKK